MKEYKFANRICISKWDEDVQKDKFSNGRLIQMFTFNMNKNKCSKICSLAFYYLKCRKELNKGYVYCELIEYGPCKKRCNNMYIHCNTSHRCYTIDQKRYVKRFKCVNNYNYYTNYDLIRLTNDYVWDFVKANGMCDLTPIFKNKFRNWKIDQLSVRKLK